MRKIEIIAEIGQNHNGDMVLARELIHAAYESGADVAKFQLYDAISLFPQEGNEWYDYNCKTELSHEQLYELNDECSKVGIEFMASAFDQERVSWLEDIGVQKHKIASRSITDKKLIETTVQTGKPLIVSLGMWRQETFPAISSSSKIDFLYCISKYPTMLEDLNFSIINFDKYSGFSDHTIGIHAALIALSRGASYLRSILR